MEQQTQNNHKTESKSDTTVKDVEPAFRELSPRGKFRATMWGTGFILLGIPGLVLPILQGVLFIAIGLILLSLASRRMHRFVLWLQRRFPRFAPAFAKAEEKAIQWFRLE